MSRYRDFLVNNTYIKKIKIKKNPPTIESTENCTSIILLPYYSSDVLPFLYDGFLEYKENDL